MTPATSRRLGPLSLACVLALGAACAEKSSEEKILEANEKVERIQRDVESAQKAVEREVGELATAQEELAEAQEWLREAQERLANAEGAVAEAADDAYLFRAIQQALLEDASLEKLAISARVRDRVVTLEGTVPKEAQRTRAEEVAAKTLGVERVENRVTVQAPTPPPSS